MKSAIFRIFDIILSPVTFLFSYYFLHMRKRNFNSLPISKKIMLSTGVFPIRDHYYDPLFDPKNLKYSLRDDRNLPGVDFNVQEQLDLLNKFSFNDELLNFPIDKKDDKIEYCFNDGPFKSGDGEILYNMIRHFKPKRFIEIGSGHSTLMVINAIKQNTISDSSYSCDHMCIEPFENKWLEQLDVKIIRKMVENTDLSVFKSLQAGDILFIDSTHMVRPQGDVLFEYLEILPQLNSGVIVHIHDIFTPKDYLDEWLDEPRFWNEQYLLEAFLSLNKDFRIIGALNYLRHNHLAEFSEKCPVLKMQIEQGENREPGSFWMVRN